MQSLRHWRGAVLLALLLVLPQPAPADGQRHTLWSIKGQYNTVYLFGSVHVLKAADHDLPAEVLRAYALAGALVMEIDLREPALPLADATLQRERLPAGQTLDAALGPGAYATLQAHLQPLGLDASRFSRMQPWFVAISVSQLELARLGFDAESGVEMQFTRRARADNKPVIGLETMDEQLGMLAQLPADQQRRFLLYCLEDAEDSGQELDDIVSAWQRGETEQLERLLGEGFAKFPELAQLLVTDRNRRWLPRIDALLRDRQDYLVIVGALHLVGKGGLVALLRDRGYKVIQQ